MLINFTGGLFVTATCRQSTSYFRGQEGVDYLDAQQGVAATVTGQDEDVRATLLRDSDLALVVGDGRVPILLYTCHTRDPDAAKCSSSSVRPTVITPPDLSDEPIADAFILHSQPNAPRMIYLNFASSTVTGDLYWNQPPYPESFTIPAYNSDATDGFSDQERREIVAIWRAVAEDFAPFAVDVTTQAPAAGALDNGVGVEVIIGGLHSDIPGWTGGGGTGVAVLGAFGLSNLNRCFVFPGNCQSDSSCVWDSASHEIGHTVNLKHDGCTSTDARCFGGASGHEYYRGHNIYNAIMGGASGQPLTQCSRGEYTNANNQEDDLNIISQRNPWAVDAVGNSVAASHSLTGVASAAGTSVSGAIVRSEDIDMFDLGQVAAGGLFMNFPSIQKISREVLAQIWTQRCKCWTPQ
jgi:hypothetical protein